jgi:O-antigen/teichoic acid export membrane protein
MSIKRIPNLIISKLNSREGLRQMKGNFIWLLADKILKMTVVMGVNIWMWNYIGTVQKGAWDYVIAIVTMLSPLASLGIDSIVIRDMVLSPEKTPRLLGASFILKLWGGILLTLIATLIVYFHRPDEPLLIYFVLITASSNIFLAFDSIDLYNQRHLLSKYTVASKSIGYIFTSILKIVFIIQGASIIAFVWTQFFEFAIGAVLMIFWYHKRGEKISSWNFDLTTARKLLQQSWPMIITSFFMFVQQNIEQLFISDWLGDSELGVYTTASRFIVLFGFIPMIIYSTVAPEITKAKTINEALFQFKLLRVYQIMFLISLSIIIGCFLFGELIINLIFTSEFEAAGFYLSLMSIRLIFVNYGVAKTLFIINNNLYKYFMIASIVGVVSDLSLIYLWVPQYGAIGAIWASTISMFISVYLIDAFYSKSKLNFKIMSKSFYNINSYFNKPKFDI